MEEKLITGLSDIGYSGSLSTKAAIEIAAQEGPKNTEYTSLVNFLTSELRTLCSIDEKVNVITGPEDSVAFIMEVGSFLKELNCPYSSLLHGHVSDRLQTVPDCLLLLDYLLTELMGARILQERKPEKKIELKLQETNEAADMRKILMTLKFPKPPPNISVQTLFEKLTPSVQGAVQKAGPDLVGQPAFNGFLSDKQWESLNDVQEDLNNDYKIRREMLLTRLDVTIQSFEWSDKTKGKDDLIEKIYSEKRKLLKVEPDVDLSDLLAARDDVAIIEKTSNSVVRKNTQSKLNKIIIGNVPDRGGRTDEQAPPPPEMPSWQQRQAGPSNRGGVGGGGGRGRGSGRQQNYSRGNYNNTGGNQAFDNTGSYGGGGGGGGGGSRGFDNTGSYRGGGNRGFDNTVSYSRGGGGGGRGGNRGFDNTGSYGGGTGGGGGGNYQNYDNRNRSFDSAGTYDNYNDRGTNYDSRSGNYDNSSYSHNRQYEHRNYDSAGSYGNNQQDYQCEQNSSKRAKTYDSFQSNRTTYADQYVQESQNNQQYHHAGRGGGGGGGRGRPNYHRGGRNHY